MGKVCIVSTPTSAYSILEQIYASRMNSPQISPDMTDEDYKRYKALTFSEKYVTLGTIKKDFTK